MTLTRPTIENVDSLLKDGNYTRAATLAISLSDNDPLVAMLARELAAVGNKKRGGRGPRKSEKVKLIDNGKAIDGLSAYEMLAAMLYVDLIRARQIIDGKILEGDAKEARALLRKHKLDKVTQWQKFKPRARSHAADLYAVKVEKLPA